MSAGSNRIQPHPEGSSSGSHRHLASGSAANVQRKVRQADDTFCGVCQCFNHPPEWTRRPRAVKLDKVLGRVGFVAKGVVYAVFAGLILTSAVGNQSPGNTQENKSPQVRGHQDAILQLLGCIYLSWHVLKPAACDLGRGSVLLHALAFL